MRRRRHGGTEPTLTLATLVNAQAGVAAVFRLKETSVSHGVRPDFIFVYELDAFWLSALTSDLGPDGDYKIVDTGSPTTTVLQWKRSPWQYGRHRLGWADPSYPPCPAAASTQIHTLTYADGTRVRIATAYICDGVPEGTGDERYAAVRSAAEINADAVFFAFGSSPTPNRVRVDPDPYLQGVGYASVHVVPAIPKNPPGKYADGVFIHRQSILRSEEAVRFELGLPGVTGVVVAMSAGVRQNRRPHAPPMPMPMPMPMPPVAAPGSHRQHHRVQPAPPAQIPRLPPPVYAPAPADPRRPAPTAARADQRPTWLYYYADGPAYDFVLRTNTLPASRTAGGNILPAGDGVYVTALEPHAGIKRLTNYLRIFRGAKESGREPTPPQYFFQIPADALRCEPVPGTSYKSVWVARGGDLPVPKGTLTGNFRQWPDSTNRFE